MPLDMGRSSFAVSKSQSCGNRIDFGSPLGSSVIKNEATGHAIPLESQLDCGIVNECVSLSEIDFTEPRINNLQAQRRKQINLSC